MASSKYGRLFTEDDVLRILRYGADRDWSEILREFDGYRRGLTFPADEPLFVIRAQDEAAPRAICAEVGDEVGTDYWGSAESVGASRELLGRVEGEAARMRAWQAAHPDRVKVPD